MPPLDHVHPINAAGIRQAQGRLLSVAEAQRLTRLLTLLGDPTRSRIVFALVAVDELCVGDLAMALDINEDQASYALKQLRTARLVQSRRDGRVIYYRLAEGFPHQLLEHCLRQLLSIAEEDS